MSSVHKRVIVDICNAKKTLPYEFGIIVEPEEQNMYNVHFIISGPVDTPFEGGFYHGMIRLNDQHPLKPPSIYMFTPSGRFVAEKYPISPNSRGICTSFTAYHPESWTPLSNIETVLKGFTSFMCDFNDRGVGSCIETVDQIKTHAKNSINALVNDTTVQQLFPDFRMALINKTQSLFFKNSLSTNNLNNNIVDITLTKSSTENKKKSIDLYNDVDLDSLLSSNDSDTKSSSCKNKSKENIKTKSIPSESESSESESSESESSESEIESSEIESSENESESSASEIESSESDSESSASESSESESSASESSESESSESESSKSESSESESSKSESSESDSESSKSESGSESCKSNSESESSESDSESSESDSESSESESDNKSSESSEKKSNKNGKKKFIIKSKLISKNIKQNKKNNKK